MSAARAQGRPFRFDRMPTHAEILWPALLALRETGRSATIDEHAAAFLSICDMPEEVAALPHGDSGRTELEYRLAWARTSRKRAGFLKNSQRGVWSVTGAGTKATEADVRAALARQRQEDAAARTRHRPEGGAGEEGWKDRLLGILLALSPDAFERLTKRLLREAGFTRVEVTGRTGDGGIDGTGILQLNLISFPVLFQCKRVRGSIPAAQIRDFRGAMMGRSDKGLFVTTGSFTTEARREATRDGAPPIELIDGPELCELLRRHGLGVRVRTVEVIEPDGDWFRQI